VCITQVAYAELAVDDLEEAVGFHTDVVGMTELGRENNHVNLGCGVDGRLDLVLHGGGTGVRLVALEIESEDDFDRYERRLSERGLDSEKLSDPRSGVARARRRTA
jgi:catechol 2,3-dioxygenase